MIQPLNAERLFLSNFTIVDSRWEFMKTRLALPTWARTIIKLRPIRVVCKASIRTWINKPSRSSLGVETHTVCLQTLLYKFYFIYLKHLALPFAQTDLEHIQPLITRFYFVCHSYVNRIKVWIQDALKSVRTVTIVLKFLNLYCKSVKY